MKKLQPHIQKIKQNKLTAGLILLVALVVIGGLFFVSKLIMGGEPDGPVQTIDLPFDAEGPYALLQPRRDGNALILNIKRVSGYEAITYELTYQSEGIDRGVQGTLDTKSKKSEYVQEILFGTCSKGDTFSTRHCVFDRNVENGTLTLFIKKGNTTYRSTLPWHMQRPDAVAGLITSGDGHFSYKAPIASSTAALTPGSTDTDEVMNPNTTEGATVTGFTIVNELSGVPKLPKGKEVFGKVYALNIPPAKTFPGGDVMVEFIDNVPADTQLAVYNEGKNNWDMLQTKVEGNKIHAHSENSGIFAALTAEKK